MSRFLPSPGLEVVPAHDPEAVSRAAVYPDQGLQYIDSSPHNEQKNLQHEKPRVFGLKRTTFWILVGAAAVIITAAAVGGGLGGGLSRAKETTASSQKASESSPSTSSTSSIDRSMNIASATATISAEVGTVSGTAKTLYRDCPSSNDTFYNVEYSSTTYEFRKLCNMQAVINGDHRTFVNQATSTLNECINLCAAYNENNVTKSTGKNICSSVCWRNGFVNNDWPGQCFGYAGNNNSNSAGFNLQADITCDSAIWVNEV